VITITFTKKTKTGPRDIIVIWQNNNHVTNCKTRADFYIYRKFSKWQIT